MKTNKSILIIGNTPPPIGGVTIHVERLLKVLKMKEVNFHFFELSVKKLPLLFFKIMKYRVIHLQTSNSYFRFFCLLWAKCLFKKTIFTFHGNVGRYSSLRNLLDKLSFYLASQPITINEQSTQFAKKWNPKTKMISAYIPNSNLSKLDNRIESDINKLKSKFKWLFCTNASAFSLDKNGNEIYQITNLVSVFSKITHSALIISDPTGNNLKQIQNRGENISENVLFINKPHDFNAVINLCQCMIRFTTTDGDALSVKEALEAGKNVIATNVVDRPKQVHLIDLDLEILKDTINSFTPCKIEKQEDEFLPKLLLIYHELGIQYN